MDTFMDKLAQKFTAQEMIKANAAAEAAELQRTREQIKQYNECLNEMKLVNEDTKNALAQIEKTLSAGMEQFQKAEIPTESFQELVEYSLSRIKELQQNTEEIQADLKNHLDSKSSELADFVHKENVKVYRNVQAAMVEECRKQSEVLEEKLALIAGRQKSNTRVAVTAMVFALLSAAGVAFQLLVMFGIV